ncbi:hypothetical protein TIFTF001_015020 [Ficus carica]|uniref:Uncharacterized protein n=1 Tax=Ficus carica TaxID=3494 RepID=A0AA88AKU7_FICCA|nr:hypothetical protein TIFTF001_015020 [Ficus carica]
MAHQRCTETCGHTDDGVEKLLHNYGVLGHRFDNFMLVKLAEVSLRLKELCVVVLTIDTLLVGHVVRRADHAATVSTPETGFMV